MCLNLLVVLFGGTFRCEAQVGNISIVTDFGLIYWILGLESGLCQPFLVRSSL